MTLTPMQVLKLVYICHGFSLGLLRRPMSKHNAEAWKYGPVIPELYDAIKQFRSRPVELITVPADEDSELSENDCKLIGAVFAKYGNLSGMQLSRLTHSKGSPWSLTFSNGYGSVISNDLIEEHYREMVTTPADA